MAGVTPPRRVLIEHVDGALIAGRLRELRERIAAATPVGATPPEVLVASKYFAPSAIADLIDAGGTLLGENRAEVIAGKQAAAEGRTVQWDFIGELQSRKAAALAPLVQRIHTLASASAARKLQAVAERGEAVPRLLVQVNVAGEPGKGGIAPGELPELLEAAGGLPVTGLMTMPPLAGRAEDNRRWFAALRALADRHGLTECSMGTSQDVLVAAQEGATVVRVGGLLTDDGAWARLSA